MATGDKLVTLDGLKAVYDKVDGDVGGLKRALPYAKDVCDVLSWVQGGASSANGQPQTSETRIRTNVIGIERGYFRAAPGFDLYIHIFDYTTHLQTSTTGWVDEYEISQPCLVRVVVRKSNNSNITTSESVNVNVYAVMSSYADDGALYQMRTANRLSLANRAYGKKLELENGAPVLVNIEDYDTSDYIPCNPYTVIRYCRFETDNTKTVYTGTVVFMYGYDKSFIRSSTLNTLYYTDEGTAYIRLLIKKGLPHVLTYDEELPDAFVPYADTKTVRDVVPSHWQGKIWYAYGTSLTNTNSEGQYPRFVDAFSGLNRFNMANSGAGITTASNGANYTAIMNTSDGKTDADLITLEVGANDMAAPIGTIYDDDDNSTFCGALNRCIRYLQTNTNAQIVIISSTNARKNNNGNAATPEYTYGPDNHTKFDQWAAIEAVCKLNSCYYIPMGETANMSYARMIVSDSYNVDNIHHTALGGYNLAQFVWSRLKSIPLWYSEMP